MVTTNEDHVETLNLLIETCKDGENGFRTAAEAVKDTELQALFNRYSAQRTQFAAELRDEVRRLGGDPERAGSLSGAMHRGWMNIRSVVSGGNEAAIIAEAERGEDSAMRAYQDALNAGLPPATQSIVQRQFMQVKEAHDRVRALEQATSPRP